MSIRAIAIVTPVLDDWDAFQRLVAEIGQTLTDAGLAVDVIAVDDGSAASPSPESFRRLDAPIRRLSLVRLALNLGHQRAIAVGLVEASGRGDIDAVLVMDSDGEDRPADAGLLIERHQAAPGPIIFARRARRSESLMFRLGHVAYKLLFRVLTGQTIAFGNFSLLPIAAVRRLCHMPDLWNNLAATIMRSRLDYDTVPTERGRRYSGRSKMNWVGLVIHGLSALSVYSDVIMVRLLVAGAAIALVALAGIAAATAIRLATDLAIPGWTTTVVGVGLVILIQTAVAIVVTVLVVLNARNRRPFVPIVDCGQFVARRDDVEIARVAAAPGAAAR